MLTFLYTLIPFASKSGIYWKEEEGNFLVCTTSGINMGLQNPERHLSDLKCLSLLTFAVLVSILSKFKQIHGICKF